jgi:hypothetical protein
MSPPQLSSGGRGTISSLGWIGPTGMTGAVNPLSRPGRRTEATLLADLEFAADGVPLAAIPLPMTGAGTDGAGALRGGSAWRRGLTTGVGMEATKAGGMTLALELAAGVGAEEGAEARLGAGAGVESAARGKGCGMMTLGALLGCVALIMCRLAFLILVLGCADGLASAGAGLRSKVGFTSSGLGV